MHGDELDIYVFTYRIEQIYQRRYNRPNTTMDGIETVDKSIDIHVRVGFSHRGKVENKFEQAPLTHSANI
jgi:hypothetical protein